MVSQVERGVDSAPGRHADGPGYEDLEDKR
jgi:hypothetical protein